MRSRLSTGLGVGLIANELVRLSRIAAAYMLHTYGAEIAASTKLEM